MYKSFSYNQLKNCDLIVDALYEGGTIGNAGDDPITKILKCGNQGGFRYSGNFDRFDFPYVVIYSSFDDYDWPDSIDFQTGILTYYGDNKKPGHQLLDTPRKGNIILEKCFNFLHTGGQKCIKPLLVFGKGTKGRDTIFRGLAVPGGLGISSLDDLQSVWKFKENHRFQNYKALFTILDIPVISRAFLNQLEDGIIQGPHTPKPLNDFYAKLKYTPLISEKSIPIRLRQEQIPGTKEELDLLNLILDYFKHEPIKFELLAADLTKMLLKDVVEIDITRPWRDGGRDAIGKLRIGNPEAFILVDFAMEAKCYDYLKSYVGVREISRLISRIKHREFGILITTSYVHSQAYNEVVVDKHPVIIVSGRDIVRLLRENGLGNKKNLQSWLSKNIPLTIKI
ncbi:MAG: restriction endonuclease [Bacteroidetes bacterium]|nr:MAG: restriction endonuclease [Bacteroidota bacterium]